MWPLVISLLTKIPGLFGPIVQAFTGINFGAIFEGVKGFTTALVKNIVQNWKIWLIGLLIAGNGFFSWEWRHTDGALIKERAAHAADINAFKQAQKEADAKASMERAVLLKESKANAAQADANYTSLLAQYHASLMRYAQGTGGSKRPGNNQLPTTKGGDGSSTSTQLPAAITISGQDAEICAVNTARLQAVHDWATNLPKDTGVKTDDESTNTNSQ